MPINQPNSALARADARLNQAQQILLNYRTSVDIDATLATVHAALNQIDLARGALNFAGNSQQKLIDALRPFDRDIPQVWADVRRQEIMVSVQSLRAATAAIAHATGPGID